MSESNCSCDQRGRNVSCPRCSGPVLSRELLEECFEMGLANNRVLKLTCAHCGSELHHGERHVKAPVGCGVKCLVYRDAA